MICHYEYGRVVDALRTPCHVKPAGTATATNATNQHIALWDTGANMTCLSNRLVSALGLKPISYQYSETAGGVVLMSVYIVDIALTDNVVVQGLLVSSGDFGTTDVLIGMDIITQGNMTITNENGHTEFSFDTGIKFNKEQTLPR